MRTPEGKVKEGVKRILKEYDVWYYMPMQNGYGKVGIPDFICCWHGTFFVIECKAPGKVHLLTPNQQRTLDEIHAHGGQTLVVDDPETVKTLLVYLRINRESK